MYIREKKMANTWELWERCCLFGKRQTLVCCCLDDINFLQGWPIYHQCYDAEGQASNIFVFIQLFPQRFVYHLVHGPERWISNTLVRLPPHPTKKPPSVCVCCLPRLYGDWVGRALSSLLALPWRALLRDACVYPGRRWWSALAWGRRRDMDDNFHLGNAGTVKNVSDLLEMQRLH